MVYRIVGRSRMWATPIGSRTCRRARGRKGWRIRVMRASTWRGLISQKGAKRRPNRTKMTNKNWKRANLTWINQPSKWTIRKVCCRKPKMKVPSKFRIKFRTPKTTIIKITRNRRASRKRRKSRRKGATRHRKRAQTSNPRRRAATRARRPKVSRSRGISRKNCQSKIRMWMRMILNHFANWAEAALAMSI